MNNGTRSKVESMTPARWETTNFGVVDGRGREIGASVGRFEFTLIACGESEGARYPVAPGFYFAWRSHSTRDGVPYGATGRERRATSEAEREAQIAAYLKGARYRAARKAVRS